MRSLRKALVAALLLTCVGARAESEAGMPIGAVIRVEAETMEFSLNERLLLLVGRGAEFQLDEAGWTGADAGRLLHVGAGPILVADLAERRSADLEPGTYLVAASLSQGVADAGRQDVEYSQGFKLGDAIMVRQQSYLDSLRIDMADLTHGIASLIRGIVRILR